MLLLFACAPPLPSLSVPPSPPAEHADALPVDRLLAPTPLGATGDLLCPWVRGEAVPDASIARWLSEGRLTWRVFDARAETFAGRPLDEAGTFAEAARTLDERCQGQRPADVLVVAAPEVPAAGVTRGLYALSMVPFEDFWLRVEDGSPAPLPASPAPVEAAPVEAATTTPSTPHTGAAAAEVLEAALGGPPPGAPLPFLLAGSTPSATVLGRPVPIVEVLGARPACVVVVAPGDQRWDSVTALVDRARDVGAEVMVGVEGDFHAEAPAVAAAPTAAGAPRTIPLHGVVSAHPLAVPRFRAGGGDPCSLALLAQERAVEPPP